MSQTVLVVDDDDSITAVTAGALTKRGFSVTTFSSGEELLDFLKGGSTADLILLDHMLPHKNGDEVCHEIKSEERLKDIPIILATGQVLMREPTGGNPKFIKPDDYLIKPFEMDELIAKVTQHLPSSNT